MSSDGYLRRTALVALALLLAAGTLSLSLAQSRAQRAGCLAFTSPPQGVAISSPSCTLTVTACPVVEAVTLSATYFLADGQTRETVRLGRITRSPFKVVWPVAKLPDQLLVGATVTAEAELLDGGRLTARREGIFLARKAVEPLRVDVSRLDRFGGEDSQPSLSLTGRDSSRHADARIYWDHQNLVFAVTVRDPGHSASLPESMQRATGCEVLLDGAAMARPYPTDSVLAIQAPLVGNVQRRRYQPSFEADGGYSLGTRLEAYPARQSVKTADGKGWKLVCTVPPALLSRANRQEIRANVVVRVAQPDGGTALYAWSGATVQEIFSPLRWGTLVLKDKPLMQKPLPLYLIGAAAGLLLVLVGYPVARRLGGRAGMVLTFETPEGERKIADMVKASVEAKVTDKAATLEDVAREFAIEPARIEQLLRKYASQSFHDYLAGLRIAVARERLRSSNASEQSVAEQCGFGSVEEMERMFLKHCRTTPYKFRLEQQVT